MVDLVAGYARGYHARKVRPFLKSLRMTGYEGRILWFADRGAAEEGERWGAMVRPPPRPVTKVHHDRFFHLAAAVKEIACEGVLVADTRDVVFQKDPSQALPSEGFHAFEEDLSMRVGSCPWNSKWIREAFGEAVLEAMADLPISCVGASCGDHRSMSLYLDQIAAGIRVHSQDTAHHNSIVRRRANEVFQGSSLRVWGNEEGEVYTVGYVPRETVKIVHGKIVNKAGRVPAVVHQWDRHENLSAFIKEVYK